MKKYLILIAVSLLSGCTLLSSSTQLSRLDAPKSLKHNSKHYYLNFQKDLDSVARYVYFEKKENSSNWKSAVELLLDRNEEERSLAERIALRKRVYKNTGVEHFDLYEQDNTLYAFVIYPPSEQHNNWQINVAKGKDIDDCGFVQYQYSLKIPKTKKMMNMGKVKLIGYLKKYVVDKELQKMSKAKWQWGCKNKDAQ